MVKFRLITFKWQSKLNETQQSDSWPVCRNVEKHKVMDCICDSVRSKRAYLFLSPLPLSDPNKYMQIPCALLTNADNNLRDAFAASDVDGPFCLIYP